MEPNIGYIIAVVILALALAVETIYIFCALARRWSSEKKTPDEENCYPQIRSSTQHENKGKQELEEQRLITVGSNDEDENKSQIRDLQNKLEGEKERNKKLRKENDDNFNRLATLEKENNSLKDQLQKKDEEVKNLLRLLQDEDKKQHSAEINLDQLKKADRNNKKEISDLKEQLQRETDKLKSLRVELQKERDEKDDALKRLSSIMSSRLRDGNPNVVDLSDQNRPLKVGEQFSELYDNQWTDAFSDIQDHLRENEENVVKLLLDILKECFATCKDTAEGQLKDLNDKVKAICGSVTKKQNRLADDLLQRIKEERKMHAMENIPSYETIVNKLTRHFNNQSMSKTDFLRHEPVAAYIKECLKLCFLMVNQDPPMTILTTPDPHHADNFKAYQNRGNHVKFVVWPALYLQEGGAMVSKGVAEFKN